MYIWQNKKWPTFRWNEREVNNKLLQVRHEQGRLLGMMGMLGFDVKNNTILDSMTSDIMMSSEIEGVTLNVNDVRSSIAWQLGLENIGLPTSDRYIEGVVEVMFDAIHNCQETLSQERLFAWHTALFPHSNKLHHITIGDWRKSESSMQVVSGRYGNEKVHYEAPPSQEVPQMMNDFLKWLQEEQHTDTLLMAAIAHLWFVTIHPFSDGNGRMSRTIMDMLLAKSDKTPYRFYSMSSAIARDRKNYYDILEKTQKGNLDITDWLLWFLERLDEAIRRAMNLVDNILRKATFWENHRHIPMNERQTKMINMLWDGFDGKLTSGKWAKINKCSSDTALRDIQDLIRKGILVKSEGEGRNTSYICTSF